MLQKEIRWVERKFDFNFSVTMYIELIHRLAKAPEKLKELTQNVPEYILKKKSDNQWSIQENAGHLLTADDLFIGRLDDYENGLSQLRPADLSGKRTDIAHYNQSDLAKILKVFRQKRKKYISRLNSHESDFFARTAWHPRLEQPMRVCDMLYFQAEHDDHHLSKITHLIQSQ